MNGFNRRLNKLLIPAVVLICGSLSAQITAITEYGDTIYVFDNGRWSFVADDMFLEEDGELGFLDREIEVDTSTEIFTTPAASTKELASRYGFYSVKYDDAKWKRIPPGELNDEAEFALQSKEHDIYCVVIAEEMSMGKEAILKVALNNLKALGDQDPKLLSCEVRQVNGVEVLSSTIRISFSGLDLIFRSYYFSNEDGTIQFTTWTGANLLDKYEAEIVDLLNGLTIKPVE